MKKNEPAILDSATIMGLMHDHVNALLKNPATTNQEIQTLYAFMWELGYAWKQNGNDFVIFRRPLIVKNWEAA
jgi:hypothetical protein